MKKVVNLLFVAALVTGCASEVPLATTHPFTTQQKLKSASHWDIIAKDTVAQAVAGLAKVNQSAVPVTVSTPQPDTPFQTGFKTFLITRLVEAGQPVAQSGAEVEVQFDAQVVRHPSGGDATVPGEITALAAGIGVVHQATQHWDTASQAAGILGLAVLADVGRGYLTAPSRTEVIVTTSVLRAGRYVTRKTDVYYLDDADGSLYEHMKNPQVWVWKVVG